MNKINKMSVVSNSDIKKILEESGLKTVTSPSYDYIRDLIETSIKKILVEIRLKFSDNTITTEKIKYSIDILYWAHSPNDSNEKIGDFISIQTFENLVLECVSDVFFDPTEISENAIRLLKYVIEKYIYIVGLHSLMIMKHSSKKNLTKKTINLVHKIHETMI